MAPSIIKKTKDPEKGQAFRFRKLQVTTQPARVNAENGHRSHPGDGQRGGQRIEGRPAAMNAGKLTDVAAPVHESALVNRRLNGEASR